MMQKKMKLLIGALSAIILITGSLSACGPRNNDPEQPMKWITEKITGTLELDEAQRQKLDNLITIAAEGRIQMQKDREQNRLRLQELIKADTFDQQLALQMIRDKSRMMEQHAPKMVSAYAEFHNSLTNEQREKLQENLTDFLEKSDRWHHRGPW